MKKMISSFLVLFMAGGLHATADDTGQHGHPSPTEETTIATKEKPATESQKSIKENIFYGGYINLSFGDYMLIGIEPMVGYRWTPKFSTGVTVRYDYIEDDRYARSYTTSNYGGSIFARYQLTPAFYAQVEGASYNHELFYIDGSSEREWVPFLFAGGGYTQPLSERTWLNVQILFDVLQDDNSPYEDWTPFFSIGIGAGF